MYDLQRELRDFIVTNYLFGDDAGLTDKDSFISKGVIDSTGVLELVLHIEETYQIQVEDHELIPENLDSIDNLVAYISRKLALKSASAEPELAAAGVNGDKP
ncbi:acyl carrier protein [Pseudacidobacterium ailaaui]|jgi:acyl carrier protein|uniref:acyl carrier protein n=1 Tax=Pseudacidobacterium ailaaui TaxID=1382359 RepID=UPI00047ADD13|nr:acyl carrier protein [Pseudacidobacterium ailaaui]MBX6360622.1 acyl carrier protein [Pseudacidobacterium ailaaui]MDI3253495.1 acyl carrier protein [Bacillota bacterium]